LFEGVLRLLGAGLLGGVGVLLLWITWQVLLDPIRNHNLVALLALKAFALLVMGSLGVGLLLGGLGVLFPGLSRQLEPRVPDCLRDLCPGCGVRREPCRCGPLPETTWTPPKGTSPLDLLLTTILVGVGALGIFVLAEGLASPNPWWARLGYLLLGLLLSGVGVLCLWGAWLSRPPRKKGKEVTYQFHGSAFGAGAERSWSLVNAQAKVRGAALVEASGRQEIHLRWPSGEASAREVDPAAHALFRLLAAAVVHGYLSLQKRLVREWSRGGAAPPRDDAASGYRDALPPGELLSGEVRGLFLVRPSRQEEGEVNGFAPPEPPEDLEELLGVLASMTTVEACLPVVRGEPALLERIEESGARASEGLDVQELRAWIAQLTAEVHGAGR
jgi:hypothetical protein